MDCDAWIWNAACKLLPACRFEHEKERLKNIIRLYKDGFYDEGDDYADAQLIHKDAS
jgi:hypothetical protein